MKGASALHPVGMQLPARPLCSRVLPSLGCYPGNTEQSKGCGHEPRPGQIPAGLKDTAQSCIGPLGLSRFDEDM